MEKNWEQRKYKCSTEQQHESLHGTVTKICTIAICCTIQKESGMRASWVPDFCHHWCCFHITDTKLSLHTDHYTPSASLIQNWTSHWLLHTFCITDTKLNLHTDYYTPSASLLQNWTVTLIITHLLHHCYKTEPSHWLLHTFCITTTKLNLHTDHNTPSASLIPNCMFTLIITDSCFFFSVRVGQKGCCHRLNHTKPICTKASFLGWCGGKMVIVSSLVGWYFEPSQPQLFYIRARNKPQSVSKLVCTQVIKPQIISNLPNSSWHKCI